MASHDLLAREPVSHSPSATKRLAWFGALFAATLPIGIAESTSVQNDYVTSSLLLAFVQGTVSVAKEGATVQRILLCILAGSLTGITKPTGYLAGLGFAVWLAAVLAQRLTARQLAATVFAATVIFGLTFGPFAIRNLHTFGSIESDIGKYTMPSVIKPAIVANNTILGIGSNFFVGLSQIDAHVQRSFLRLTSALGTDRQSADFKPPFSLAFLFHEDFAPNPLPLRTGALFFSPI
jgi:hypothetical protein